MQGRPAFADRLLEDITITLSISAGPFYPPSTNSTFWHTIDLRNPESSQSGDYPNIFVH